MNPENKLHCAIQDIRYAGEHPLLQYDILDSRTLLNVLKIDYPLVNAWRLSKILKVLELRPLGIQSVCRQLCYLWTCLPPQPLKNILVVIRERMEKNQTKIGTHLLIDPPPATPPPHALLSRAEKEVLDMRIENMSFAQIATARGCAQSTVGALASTACRKLGLKGSCYSHLVNRAMYGVQPERVLTMEDF